MPVRKQFVVIGLGRFGRAVAKSLAEVAVRQKYGVSVLAILRDGTINAKLLALQQA